MNGGGNRRKADEKVETDEEVVTALQQSPWEQGMKRTESRIRMRAAKIPCEWCGMFAALPGMPRCSLCVPPEGGRR